MLRPAGVGVGHQTVARAKQRADGADPLDIDVRVAADFELKARVSCGAIAGNLGGHLVGRFLRDRAVQPHPLAEAASHQYAYRQPRGLAQHIPAGDVDARLDIGMPLERRVHTVIQVGEFARIAADQMGRQLLDSGAHSRRVGRKIEWPERADLAITDQPGIRSRRRRSCCRKPKPTCPRTTCSFPRGAEARRDGRRCGKSTWQRIALLEDAGSEDCGRSVTCYSDSCGGRRLG